MTISMYHASIPLLTKMLGNLETPLPRTQQKSKLIKAVLALDLHQVGEKVELIREVMVRNGDGHKPLWLAEVGWSALPVDFPGAAIHGRVTLDQQARYTADALRRIRSEWPWVGVTFLWHFRRVSDELRSF